MTITGVDSFATVATYITCPTIPPVYSPLSNINVPITVFDNSLFTTGNVNVVADGEVYITLINGDVFTGTGSTGFSTTTFTWTTTA